MDRELGAVPQGIIEQARARPVDPGRLQLLGKQAAALYSSNCTPLSDAVLEVIKDQDLGPEHARRVCEFANQSAFQNEWEKGGSVRNIEFEGGPADPSVVLKGMNDGSQPDTHHVDDYSAPPSAPQARNVEEEIFGKQACAGPTATGLSDLHALRTTAMGAREHVMSKISSLTTRMELLKEDLYGEVKKCVLVGEPLSKIAAAWSHFGHEQDLYDGISAVRNQLVNHGVMTKRAFIESLRSSAAVGHEPNPEHGVISTFIEFSKTATELRQLQGAVDVLDNRIQEINTSMLQAMGQGQQLQRGLRSFDNQLGQIEQSLSPAISNPSVKMASARDLDDIEDEIEKVALGFAAKAALGGAVVPGLLGAGIGAATAKPGERGSGALKGALIGGGLGAGLAGGASLGLGKKVTNQIAAGVPGKQVAQSVSQVPGEAVRTLRNARIGTVAGGAAGLGAGIVASGAIPGGDRR